LMTILVWNWMPVAFAAVKASLTDLAIVRVTY
jgi:hypothetical protein